MRLAALFTFMICGLRLLADDGSVDELLRQLASEDPAARQQAEDRLVELGASAESRLKDLPAGADPEVQARIQSVLRRIEAQKIASTDLVELRTIRVGGGKVTALAWGPDSKQLFTCGWGGDVRIWDASTGKLERTFKPTSGYVPGLAVGKDGKRLWMSGENVIVWDLEAAKEIKSFKGGGHTGVLLSPDGARSVWLAGGIQIAKTSTLEVERTIPAGDMWTDTIAFSPDSRNLLLMQDRHLAVLDLETGEYVADHPLTKVKAEGTVMRLGWLADGTALVVNREGKIAWGTHTAEAMAYRYQLSVAPDGKSFAVGGPSGEVRCLDLEGKELSRHDLGGSLHEALEWSPDGSALAATNEAGRLIIWRAQESLEMEGHTQEPERIAFSPDGTVLAACIGGLTSSRTDFVDLETGKRASCPGLWDPQPGRSGVQFVSPDGLEIITWDGRTGVPSAKPSRDRKKRPSCEKIYTSPDGTLAWLEGFHVPAEKRLYSFTDAAAPIVKESVGCTWSDGAWSSDSEFVATLGHLDFHGHRNALTVVRRDGQVLLRQETGSPFGTPCWTPDSRRLYWTCDKSLFVYDRENFEKPLEYPIDFSFEGFIDDVRAFGVRGKDDEEKELLLVHVPTRLVVKTWKLPKYGRIRLTRDGSRVAILSSEGARVMTIARDGKK